MERRDWILGVALVAAAFVAPQRAHSVTWTLKARVYEVTGAVPDGIELDSPVTVTWTYDPNEATDMEDSSCERTRFYELPPASGSIEVSIGATSWSYDLRFLQVHDDAECSPCYDARGDALQLFSGDDFPSPGVFLLLVDCYTPHELLTRPEIPRNQGELNQDAAAEALGMIWGSGWLISFEHEDPSPVTNTTWTKVKNLYR